MPTLHVRLFGPPIFERAGKRVEVDTRKAIALLAYLALAERPAARAVLALLLWPEYDQQRAAANLRRTLWSLNNALGAGLLVAENDTLALMPSPALQIDVVEFRRLLAEAQGHGHAPDEVCTQCSLLLAAAAELSRGDFLEGFSLRDAVEFDDWQSLTTASLRNELSGALRRLAQAHIAAGDLQAARGAVQRLVSLDPLDQPAAGQLMLLRAWVGEHAGALRVYRDLERLLQQELGVEPDRSISRLFDAIKERREPPPPTPLAAPGHAGTARQAPAGGEESSLSGAPPFPAGSPAHDRFVFVGRQQELAALDDHLQAACEGRGHVVFVAGEAGQGKTALLQAFARRAAAAHPHLVAASGSCNAYTGTGDPYLPFREILELLTGAVEARTLSGALDQGQALRLWRGAGAATAALVEQGPDLLDTLVPVRPLLARNGAALPVPTRLALEQRLAHPAVFDPTFQQASLFEQLTQVLSSIAAHSPLLLAVDDLQWGDAGSLALLFHLGRRLAGAHILILAAYRPNDLALGRQGERHPLEPILHELQRRDGDTAIDLSASQDRAFVEALLDSEPNRLGNQFRDELFRQTGGHALFTSELLRGMQERGDLARDEQGFWVARPSLDWERLPARVEAVIAERLGRLPSRLRDLLRAASVEGEEFSAEVAAHLLGMDEAEARRHLSGELAREHRLLRGLGVQRIGDSRLTRYRFHHYLIQRSLYAGLDAAEQVTYNEDAGTFLESVYGGQAGEIAVALAHHFDAAGLPAKAVVYYRQAGDRALRFSANVEAAEHYGRALALLEQLPETPERLQEELALQAAYSVPVQHLEGWASPRAEAAFERALALARQFGSPAPTLPLLGRIAHSWVYRGEHRRALALAQELLQLAMRAEDDAILLEAHTVVGLTQFYMGDFAEAQGHLDAALALYDPARHAGLTYLYGQDAGVHAGLYRMLNLTMLGYADQGKAQAAETIALAEGSGHPFTLAFAWNFVALAAGLRLDIGSLSAAAENSLAVARAHSFPTWTSFGLIAGGYGRGVGSDAAEGFGAMVEGLDIALPTGAQTPMPFIFGLLSELYALLGQEEEALHMVDVGLAMAQENREGLSIPDLHRRRGELLLAMGRPWSEADAALRQAAVEARSRSARLHELRALAARLRAARLHAPGEVAVALTELAACCGWFTEGWDAADLLAARRELGEGTS